MPYELVDLIAYFLYSLKYLAIFLAVTIFLFGLDDLFIDIAYWSRWAFRNVRIYSKYKHADEKQLYSIAEKPLAIMVPAWSEVGVIGKMASLAATTLDYENYQIFVGTYPNDPLTQADVDEVCQHYSNVHKVICVRPGPTSKADCLNNIIAAILHFEEEAKIEFAGFILHDSEDVISPMELRLFNFLLPRKDMIQIPVYPFAVNWNEFTAGHYLDEFAENHGKEVVIREALTQQVPSAGVGTCFSRKAIIALLEDGEGIAFNTQSLTEDYDIGFRLGQKGLKCVFARYSVNSPDLALKYENKWGIKKRDAQVICVREHFPRDLTHAVRQKSRWIVGIVFQGARNLGWSSRTILDYFLWRDRRGLFAYLLSFMVNLLFAISLCLWISATFIPNAWHFPSILSDSAILSTLLWLNGALLLNRMFQRFYFVSHYYGIAQGSLAIPRMFWSNLVNFLANIRALQQVVKTGDSRRVAWDKTTHEFPTTASVTNKPLGRRLIEKNYITEEQLAEALTSSVRRRLGRELLLRGYINTTQLLETLAEQYELEWRAINPFKLNPTLIAKLPRHIALRYLVLPVEETADLFTVASETPLNKVILSSISRQINQRIRCVLAPQGRISLGIRHWYPSEQQSLETKHLLLTLEKHQDDAALLESVAIHQVLLGNLLQVRGIVPPSLFAQAIISYQPEKTSLGQHLIELGMITSETLEKAIAEQNEEQQASYYIIQEMLDA